MKSLSVDAVKHPIENIILTFSLVLFPIHLIFVQKYDIINMYELGVALQ